MLMKIKNFLVGVSFFLFIMFVSYTIFVIGYRAKVDLGLWPLLIGGAVALGLGLVWENCNIFWKNRLAEALLIGSPMIPCLFVRDFYPDIATYLFYWSMGVIAVLIVLFKSKLDWKK